MRTIPPSVHTEPARHAFAALQALKAKVSDDNAFLTLERSINALDQEVYENQTLIARTLVAAEMQKEWILPEIYDQAKLTPQEREILFVCWKNRGKVVTTGVLMNALYGSEPGDAPLPEIIKVRKCTIARKLKAMKDRLIAAGEPWDLQNEWGRGLRLLALSAQ